jgi:flagellar L-ring protein precursor FlgH
MNKKLLLTAIVLALSVGCNAAKEEPGPMMSMTPPPQAMTPEEQMANPGSLFNEVSSDFLFSDNRARRVGDIVLIKVEEVTRAKNKADTTSERTNAQLLQVDAFLGHNYVLGIPVGVPGVSSRNNSNFSATGETTRENNVLTTVAARVINVLPSGILQVEGSRETRVNDETQHLVITGLVRARDIEADNSVRSSLMADSKMALFGKGTISDKQSPGWLTRLLDNLWPF